MRAALLALVAACGAPPAPHRDSSPPPAPRPSPAPAAEEAAKPADLTPGAVVVVAGPGIMEVVGPHDFEGKPGIHFTNKHTGMGYFLGLDDARDPANVRAPISKAEAERRLAILADPTPVTDTRPSKVRSVELERTAARGTDIQKLALLRAYYASTFAAAPHDATIYHLEELVLPELAYVLGTDQEALATKLHAIHAAHGTYAKSAVPRAVEPEPAPPKDPWSIAGHAYVGTFTLAGDTLVAGDPVYVPAKRDEANQDVSYNTHVRATAGRWLCYEELDPKHPDDVTRAFIAIHESARDRFATARAAATKVAKLWVDSGRMAVVDAAIRDDAAYDDARLFGADDHGIIGGRGCEIGSFGGDGTFATRVVAGKDGRAIYLRVDFTDAAQ